jgi:hypothetical protein
MSILRVVVGVGLLVLVTIPPAEQPASVFGQSAVVRVAAPAAWPPDAGSFEVRVEVEGVADLAAFEFRLAFDPVVLAFEAVEVGSFLGDTGRSVACSDADFFTPQHDIFAFACTTLGPEPAGPGGSGVLATARFRPIGRGPSPLHLIGVRLTDTLGREILATLDQGSVTIGRSADTPVPTATPVGTSPGPLSTATPSPIPPGYEALPLVPGCAPVANTYPEATPVGRIASGVSPPGILDALWEFEAGAWLGYSPRFPEVSDLTETGSSAVFFVCVNAPGSFLRPGA